MCSICSIALVSIWFGTVAPLVLWVIPRLIGEPFMRWLRIAEHGECEEGGDLHEIVRDKMHPVGESYPAVHAEVLGKISRHEGVTWQNAHFIAE